MKKYLIVGGAGFIGTNLAAKLLKQNNEVTIVDDFSTGRKENIIWLNQQFGEIEVIEKWKRVTAGLWTPEWGRYRQRTLSKKFDVIYYLASPASPPKYMAMPMATYHANTIDLEHVCRIAVDTQAQLIYTSSSEIYGEPLNNSQKETDLSHVNSYGPRACYNISKMMGETILYTWQREFKLESKIIRVFNTYGPHMDPKDGRVVSNFIIASLQNKPFNIYGILSNRSTDQKNDIYNTNNIKKESIDQYNKKSILYNIIDQIKNGLSQLRFANPMNKYLPQPTQKPNIFSDIKTRTRSFCYIDDLLNGFEIIENSNVTTPINLGNDQELDLITLALKIKELTKSESEFIFLPGQENDPMQRKPDLTKVKTLGYMPSVDLDTGLKQTIEYFRKELKL